MPWQGTVNRWGLNMRMPEEALMPYHVFEARQREIPMNFMIFSRYIWLVVDLPLWKIWEIRNSDWWKVEERGLASAGKSGFLMFGCILWEMVINRMFKRRKPDPEKKHIFSCKMHSFRTMVVIRFKMWQIPRRNSTLEEKTGYISTLKH